MKSKKVVNVCVLMFIMMMAAVFIIFLSGSTSFLISNFYSFDSAIFQVIGKGWSQGLIPYTQCFDHKGPLIFLIDAIGYGFGIGKNGIMIVQWVFMVCTMYIAYKTGKLLMKTGLSFLAMIFMWATMMACTDCAAVCLPCLAVTIRLSGAWAALALNTGMMPFRIVLSSRLDSIRAVAILRSRRP